MTISKHNHFKILAQAKRHYNLQVDEFVAVSDYAMMLCGAKAYTDTITIAVSPERFKELKKYVLPECKVRGHIQLTSQVLCRRMELPENENKRWVGHTWSLTREYITACLNSALQARDLPVARQKVVSRELELLAHIDAGLTVTSNKAKADLRIKSAAMYLGVKVTDLVVIDQTIECLRDDIATDNGMLIIGISVDLLSKIKRKVVLPEVGTFFSHQQEYKGIETDDNTYLVSLRDDWYEECMGSQDVHIDKKDDRNYLAYKYL